MTNPDKKLTSDQIKVLREAATEAPFSGALLYEHNEGTYHCADCGSKLFVSSAKFDSNSGWPSFDDTVIGAVQQREDTSNNMSRIEIFCAKCQGHLGHVFPDGPKETTGLRYCVNSLSLDFINISGRIKSGAKK